MRRASTQGNDALATPPRRRVTVRCNCLSCGSTTGEKTVKQQYAECKRAYGVQFEVSNEHRPQALP